MFWDTGVFLHPHPHPMSHERIVHPRDRAIPGDRATFTAEPFPSRWQGSGAEAVPGAGACCPLA